ncbi:MAG: hypothetical protein LBI99_09365 [Propionibacteriaceae bacterium]|jgi:hypothetical protein|nr:hypothetical protein [Propionibacteriaceae bacterium]
MTDFDDASLEDAAVVRAADHLLRPIAEAGARLRREKLKVAEQLDALSPEPMPRAIIAFGPESRLLRAVLEPTCPVPFVAWPRLGLPTWVGPLDLVVAMGATNPVSLAAASEAVRRGARLLAACPPASELAKVSAARATTLLPISAEALTCAVLVLDGLRRLGVGQQIDIEAVADAMDLAASECSALRDSSSNPAKRIALELAEAQPLVWGGSILAARASRRIAEALRAACGQVVLAADAGALLPLLGAVPPRDVFADPFEQTQECRPGLVVLDDGLGDELAQAEQRSLADQAMSRGVLVSRIECSAGDRVTRYVTLLHHGLFAAAYLQIGCGRQAGYP